mgnify:CR=1 FL=1
MGHFPKNRRIFNRTFCHPILSIVMVMIDKLDSYFAVIWFCSLLAWLQTKLESSWSYYQYELMKIYTFWWKCNDPWILILKSLFLSSWWIWFFNGMVNCCYWFLLIVFVHQGLSLFHIVSICNLHHDKQIDIWWWS